MAILKCPNCAGVILAADASQLKQIADSVRRTGKLRLCPTCKTLGDDAPDADASAAGQAPPPPPATPPPPPGVDLSNVLNTAGQVANLAAAGVGDAVAIANALQRRGPQAPVRVVGPMLPPPVVLTFAQRHRDLLYGSGGIIIAILVVAVILKFTAEPAKSEK